MSSIIFAGKVKKALVVAANRLVKGIDVLQSPLAPVSGPSDNLLTIHVGGSKVSIRRNWLEEIALPEVRNVNGTQEVGSFEFYFAGNSALLIDQINKAMQITEVFIRCICVHFRKDYIEFCNKHSDDIAATVLMYTEMIHEDKWVGYVKYQTNWLFCHYERDRRLLEDYDREYLELPAKPITQHCDGQLMLGQLNRTYFRQKMRVVSKKTGLESDNSKSWRWTVLQGLKRGLPKVSNYTVKQSAIGHKNRLSKNNVTPTHLLDQIERTAAEAIGKKIRQEDWTDVSLTTNMSTNACFEQGRKDIGVWGEVVREIQRNEGSKVDLSSHMYHVSVNRETDMWKMMHNPSLNKIVTVYRPIEHWSDSYTSELSLEDCNFYNNIPYILPCLGLVFNQPKTLLDSVLEQIHEPAQSGVRFILEPLKVRTITKGTALSNGVFPIIQKRVWKSLQKFTCFSLTGETATSLHIDQLRQKTFNTLTLGVTIHDYTGMIDRVVQASTDLDFETYAENLFLGIESLDSFISKYKALTSHIGQGDYMVSGDYSAATDNLHMDCSKAVIRAISGDPLTQQVLLKGMCDNEISYSKAFEGIDDKDFPEKFTMTNGQLMGSVFSFPILCIINAAVYRASLEQYLEEYFSTKIRISLDDLPCLVNGDDIAFMADARLLEIWEENIALVGFEKSLGKNFVSSKFCTINSEYFFVPTKESNTISGVSCAERIPYTNCGFLFGEKKGQQQDDKSDQATTVSSIRTALNDNWNRGYQPSRLHFERQFYEIRKDEINKTHLPYEGDFTVFGLGFHTSVGEERFWEEKYRRYLSRNLRGKQPLFGHVDIPESLIPWKGGEVYFAESNTIFEEIWYKFKRQCLKSQDTQEFKKQQARMLAKKDSLKPQKQHIIIRDMLKRLCLNSSDVIDNIKPSEVKRDWNLSEIRRTNYQ